MSRLQRFSRAWRRGWRLGFLRGQLRRLKMDYRLLERSGWKMQTVADIAWMVKRGQWSP